MKNFHHITDNSAAIQTLEERGIQIFFFHPSTPERNDTLSPNNWLNLGGSDLKDKMILL